MTAERTDTGERFEVTCSFVFSCSGYYRYDHGYQPEFAGHETGSSRHRRPPQAWPEDMDFTGKRVVVIGSGATAVTLIPSLAATAAHVTMLQRSPTYMLSLPAVDPDRQPCSCARCCRAVSAWAPSACDGSTPSCTQGFFQLSRRRPELMKRFLRKGVERQAARPAMTSTRIYLTLSTYNPWDQRLCLVPDGDLFKAISAGTASVVTDHIDTFTETGLRLTSGAELEADVIVTATGLELLFLGGIELSVDGAVVDPASRLTYKGMMLEGVPNLAVAIGYTNASWTLKCDLTCGYVCRLVNHMRANGRATSSARRSTATPAVIGRRCSWPFVRLHPALRPPVAQARLGLPLAGPSELLAGLPRLEDEQYRGRRHGVPRRAKAARRSGVGDHL